MAKSSEQVALEVLFDHIVDVQPIMVKCKLGEALTRKEQTRLADFYAATVICVSYDKSYDQLYKKLART